MIIQNYCQLTLKEWLASSFSSQYHSWINHEGHNKKRNDHQAKKLLNFKQILLISTQGMYREQYGEYSYWYFYV